jgi:hypothetical protein
MNRTVRKITIASMFVLLISGGVYAQVHKFFSPGTIWTITAIQMKAGMDQAYLEYLDGQFKKESDAQVKAGYMKSYKILRTLDDEAGGWNMVILREYTSLASMEANEEKSDTLSAQLIGNDQAQMAGYTDRSKIREVMWTKTAREYMLK